MNKIAIIDMGTNTFHLLLAERGPSGYTVFHRGHEAVKIGKGGINEGVISESACARALEAMRKFRKTIDQQGVTTVYAFATSAFRNARNARELAAEIKSCTNISIQIISGEEEANYIFHGIKAGMDLGNDVNLVMDIGAGSVEFIIGNKERILWLQSFEIGGQRLLEIFHHHDPILPEEIDALYSYFEKMLKPLMAALKDFQPRVLIGSAGTFDTLSNIFCMRRGHQLGAEPETPLTADGFYEIYNELIRKNRDERMQIPGMIALRVDLIVVSCCLIYFLLEKHPFERIRVSKYSLKEGVLAKLAR